ncbi:hypothetical protein NA57DRAFT_57479 [Rhizodiscina lignyota]|uniref:Uncharacterized protein n=1 Tax=Rhizodiscina lignyota TaxID=1504668 RepID=A0A9P4IFD8_9PEZI|nr:hypothetical protein NA57DRAFT_57479 [Rhizodiscina lignyota]
MKATFFTTTAFALQVAASPFDTALSNVFKRQDSTGWRDITCTTGSLTDVSNDPVQQWIDAKTTDAMRECIDAYNSDSKGLTFSNFVANFFNARPGISCGLLDNDNCAVSVNCGQGSDANAPVNSPAGYVVINSMVGLHIQFENYFKGLQNALNFMNGEIGTFSDVFAPQFDPLSDDKILIDVLNLCFAVVSAGAFNSWFKNLQYFKGQNANTLGVAKDTTNAAVAQSLNILKDSSDALDKLKVQNTMSSFLSQTVQQWMNSTETMTKHIFEEDAVLGYYSFVNGKSWDPNSQVSALDVTQSVEQTLYAYMAPIGWKLATSEEIGAFIATADELNKNGDGCGDYDKPTDNGGTVTANWDDDIMSKTLVCLDGTAYWLVNLQRSQKPRDQCSSTPAISPGVCSFVPPEVKMLPGVDQMDGQKWGGLTKEILVASAVKSWQNNGNKNGWASTDASTENGMRDVIDNGINAQGVVNIPVCSFPEAINNGYPDENTPNWPCN